MKEENNKYLMESILKVLMFIPLRSLSIFIPITIFVVGLVVFMLYFIFVCILTGKHPRELEEWHYRPRKTGVEAHG